jgi:hypothetical protein
MSKIYAVTNIEDKQVGAESSSRYVFCYQAVASTTSTVATITATPLPC